MKNSFFIRVLTLIVTVSIIAFASGCGKDVKTSGDENSFSANVTVYEACIDNISENVKYNGEIMASETTAISPMVSGKVSSVRVKEGDVVSKGEVLMSVDTTTYQLAYNQALAAYNTALASKKSAQASYNSVTGGSSKQTISQLSSALSAAKIAYDNANDNYNKQKTLFDMGAISQSEFDSYKIALDNAKLNYDTAKSNYDITKNVVTEETKAQAKAGVDTASANVEGAKAALDIAKNNLSNCTVTAPISGVVSSKTVGLGQMVSAGMTVFTISNTNMVDVEIHVTESVISKINVGTVAKINVKSVDMGEISGAVTMVNPITDERTGMYTVRISIDNSNGALKQGMVADISLVTKEIKDALSIPSEAIMEDEDGYFVYVAVGDRAERKNITIGIEGEEYTEILSGIEKGDKVIVSGKEYISEDNNQIRVVPSE